VGLVDVVRAAIAETEDLDRVVFSVDERLAVFGNAVADLTHLVAELVENAVHFSPPEASVVIRTRPFLQTPGGHVLTVEDWGVGMRPEDLAAANELLAVPREVDLSVSQRLGLHVVARLAKRHGIEVSLTPTPGCGVTAAVVLPPSLFAATEAGPEEPVADEADVTAEVVPVALPASVAAAPAAPPAPPGWSRAERWVDLPDEPRPAGNGNGHDDGRAAGPEGNGDGADWSGWWEPSPGDLGEGGPGSPLAARPPLSERAQPPPSSGPQPHPPRVEAPEARSPQVGAPQPHPPASAPPEGEGSQRREGVPPAVHSPRTHNPPRPVPADPPRPVPVAVEAAAGGMGLARRVPQAHLAPELRRHGRAVPAAEAEGALPDAAEARAALSRYQASRQAAKVVVDEGVGGRAGDAGSEGPPANGGWS
jgi:histidine kinase/DNA gyrase B/HSP90-like ATPase